VKRNSFIFATFALAALITPCAAQAQEASGPETVQSINDKRVADLVTRAVAKQKAATKIRPTDPAAADKLSAEADALYAAAMASQEKSDGIIGGVQAGERAEALERERMENQKDMYGKPSFWDKVGDKALDLISSTLSSLIQQWIAGGGEDDALLNRINELQDERDRLTNERDNPTGGDGVGRIITDPNGN
jgi:hypothetical protein